MDHEAIFLLWCKFWKQIPFSKVEVSHVFRDLVLTKEMNWNDFELKS